MSQKIIEELTHDESLLGFKKVYMRNSESYFWGQGSIILAVVYRLEQCDIIKKIFSEPHKRPEYSHQKYGTYGSGGRPDWKPVLTPYPSASMAIDAARLGRDMMGVAAQHINIAEPEIQLRCPKCSHQFTVYVDLIPFENAQQCPECDALGKIGEFNAIRM